MSLSSIKFSEVVGHGLPSGKPYSYALNENDYGYIAIPLCSDLRFSPKTGDEITVKPLEFVICSGGAGVKLSSQLAPLIRPVDSAVQQSIPQKNHYHDSLENGANNLDAIVLRIELCETFKSGLRTIIPTYLHVREDCDEAKAHLKRTAEQIQYTIQHSNDYTDAIRDRLAETLFIQGVRYYFGSHPIRSSAFRLFKDRRLRGVVKAVHDHPGRRWTVESLANVANMSRSLFAQKFKYAVNVTPLGYVRVCRVEKAKSLLKDTDESLDHIAQQTGYSSISSFVKAFSSVTGDTPGHFREKKRSND